MMNFSQCSTALLSAWSEVSQCMMVMIDHKSKILNSNKAFDDIKGSFTHVRDMITLTHRADFEEKLSVAIKNSSTLFFKTNLSLRPEDVEDIPYSFWFILDSSNEDEIIIISEPLPSLNHSDAKTYFSLVNEFSVVNRRLLQAEHRMKKLNLELREKFNEVDYLANHDTLTNVSNRRRILEDLSEEISRFTRLKKPFCILILDIDHFKRFNDEYGHPNGDVVLKCFTKNLISCLRPYDKIGRIGGEEFLLILPETSISEAKTIAKRLLDDIASQEVVLLGGQYVNVTFSGGLKQMEPNLTSDNLVLEADKLLYKAKENGRKQVLS